eukprot:1729740-Ditylum_brightwellii.AAC.1
MVDEWLRFLQNLWEAIKGISSNDTNEKYAIIKSLFHEGALMAYKSEEGNNGLQTDPTNNK